MSNPNNWLEVYVAERLKSIYKYSRPTIASGSTPIEKGDTKNPYFVTELKDWNTSSFSIKNDVWLKLKYQAAREMKDPVYITRNKTGNILVSMDFDDWVLLVNELIELREKIKNE